MNYVLNAYLLGWRNASNKIFLWNLLWLNKLIGTVNADSSIRINVIYTIKTCVRVLNKAGEFCQNHYFNIITVVLEERNITYCSPWNILSSKNMTFLPFNIEI